MKTINNNENEIVRRVGKISNLQKKKMKKEARIVTYVSNELYNSADTRAQELGLDLSSYVRTLITKDLQQY